MAQQFSDAARSELTAGISAGDTTFTLVDGSRFPEADAGTSAVGDGNLWFKAVLQDETGFEIVYVRTHAVATTPNTLSNVLRGQEGTTARSFAATSVIGVRLTAFDMATLWATMANKAANNVTLTDEAGTSTLPATTAAPVASHLQVLRNNVKQAFADLAAKADLVGGKVPEAQLPAIAITDVFSVASQSAMLALAAERGDIAVRSDIDRTFVLAAEPASTLANWVQLRTPTDAVLSVAGKTGAVTLSKSDVGLSNVDNTADANKPVATTSVNGLMSAADKTKLNGVASGATANATDAQLRDRSTHTGTQAQSTVTNLTSDLAARVNRQDSYATVTSGVIDLGLETELYHMTVSGNVTVSVSNAPSSARVVKRLIVQYSSGVVTWPASFKLPTPMPTFAAGKAYVFSIEQSPNSGVYFLVPGPEYTYP